MLSMITRLATMLCLYGLAMAVSASSGSMRCEGYIIDAGTYRAEVFARCGEPSLDEGSRLFYLDGLMIRIVHFQGGKISRIESMRR